VKRRHLLRLAAAAPACLAFPKLATAASGKIVLGQSAAFSGPASALGERFKEGALLAFDRINARGVVISQVMPLPFSATAPVSADYLSAGKSLGDKFEPNYGGIEGFVAARTLIEGLRQAGNNPTPESLVTALENMRELNLGGFFIDFTAQSHAGSKYVDMTILTAEGKVRH